MPKSAFVKSAINSELVFALFYYRELHFLLFIALFDTTQMEKTYSELHKSNSSYFEMDTSFYRTADLGIR